MKNFLFRNREAALALIVVALALAVGLRAPVFLTGGNLIDVLNDSSILAILVMGQMVVLLTKGIDLSVSSNLALTGMFCAVVGRAFHRARPRVRERRLARGGHLEVVLLGIGLDLVEAKIVRSSRYQGLRRADNEAVTC